MCEDLLRFIESMGLGPINIGGISDGAIVAMHMGIYHPEMVKNLILVGVNYMNDDSANWMNRQLTVENVEMGMPELANFYAKAHDPHHYPGYWKQLLTQVVFNAQTNLNYSLADLQKISAPTLLIAGETICGAASAVPFFLFTIT